MKKNTKVEVVESRNKGFFKAGIAGVIGLGLGVLGTLGAGKLLKKSDEEPEDDDDDYEAGDEVDGPDDEEDEEE